MVIRQGDVFWIDFDKPKGHGPAYRHPYVVVQGDVYNQSNLGTTVVCGITSKLHRAQYPGNVLLKKGEANLAKDSVVNVSQLYTVDKRVLSERIGTLESDRLREIVSGIGLLLDAQ